MLQSIASQHFVDADGNPAGGTTYGVGFAIGWQHGPLGRGDDRQAPNGAFVEGVIAAAADRIEFYQSGKFKHSRNGAALEHLHAALRCLEQRTTDREARGVEGTHAV